MKKISILFCLFLFLTTFVFSQSEVIPLAAGNKWSYVTKKYNENGTLKSTSQTMINILKDTTINYQGTSVKVFIWNTLGDSWKWFMKNESDGLYCYGIKKPYGTTFEKMIQIKYPANVGEKFTSTYNGFLIGKEIILESKSAQVVTPSGTNSCYLYSSTFDNGYQYFQMYVIPGKGIIALKSYHKGKLESETLLGYGTGFGTNLAPSTPQLFGPDNNLSIFRTSQVLSWNKCTDPEGALLEYQVYMWKDFDPYKYIKSVYATASNVVTAQVWGLEKGENYNWKIVVSDGVNFVESEIRYFQVNLSATDVLENKLPTFIALHQNYPNPFNPTTQISFSVPRTTFVSLKIYNSLGLGINTLLEKEIAVGTHQVAWDGKNRFGHQVPSGVYYYTLLTEGFRVTRKMILLK